MNQEHNQQEHVYRDYVTVGDAASLLGVSIDTVRRWEKAGKLKAERIDGKNRYFPVDELEAFKAAQPLTTTEVAVLLGVSPSTVRRLDASGQLGSVRDENGKRQYTRGSVQAYVNGEAAAVTVEQVSTQTIPLTEVGNVSAGRAVVMAAEAATLPALNEEPLTPDVLTETLIEAAKTPDLMRSDATFAAPVAPIMPQLSTPSQPSQKPQKPHFRIPSLQLHVREWAPWKQAVFSLGVIFVALVMLVAGLFMAFPDTMARVFGYTATNQQGKQYVPTSKPLFARVMKPITAPALNIVEVVNPSLREQISPQAAIGEVNDVFMVDPDGNIVSKYTLSVPDSSYLKIPDQGLVANLNSELVQGRKPGTADGDLAILPINGMQIANGSIQLEDLSSSLQAQLRSGGSGSSGSTGATGPRGATGATGLTGSQGIQGLQGPAGPAGPQGPAGSGGGGGGSINDIVAGNGLNGGGSNSTVTLHVTTGNSTEIINDGVEVKVAINGTTGTTSSVSGLEVTNQGLRLIGGCSVGQIMKWNGAAWACATDSGGSGGSMNVQASDGSVVVSSPSTLQFGDTTASSNEFLVQNLGGGNARIRLGNNVLLTTNYTTTLDPTYVNATETPVAGDISGSYTTGFAITADAVTLGTDTTGSYVASIAGSSGLAVAGSGEGAAVALSLDITTVGTTGTISSNSGLELASDGLRLIGGCSAGQVLKWTGTTWMCSADNGGSAALDVKENGTTIVTGAGAVDFLGADFVVTGSGSEADIAIDYNNSGITRRTATEVITGNWSFNDNSFALQDNADNSKKVNFELSGLTAGVTRSLTVPNVNGTLITSGNLSDITAVGTVTSGVWQGSMIGTQYGGTGINGSSAPNGSLLIGNGTGYSLGTLTQGSGITVSNAVGSITVSATLGTTIGSAELENDAVALGVQTSGNYVSSLGTLIGLTVTGNTGEGSTPNLSVAYGSTASTAVEGSTSISVAAGSNLSGGGNITLGAGGSVTLNTVANPSFGTSVTTPLVTNAGQLTVSTTGVGNNLTLSTAGQLVLSGFNCSTFDNGGVLTVNASGVVSCDNDDGGAAGSLTGSGTTNRIPLYTGTSSLANSWLAQNVSTIEIDNTRNLSLLGGNLSVTGTGLFTGLITANGGITVEAGDTLIVNGDAFTDLTGNGLNINSGALGVTYGSTANTAAQGNTSFTCATGTGNLSGGGTSIAVGAGGACGALDTVAAPSFTSVTAGILQTTGVLGITTNATLASDDIVFTTGGVEALRVIEGGDLKFEKGANDVTFQIMTPSGAPATYTFSGATGTVLTSANYSASLDSAYVNVGESPTGGDIAGTFSGGLTINNAAVTNAKLQNSSVTVTGGNGLSGGGSVSLGGSTSLSVLYGSSANTAVQGNTTLTCASGTGNLSGGGNTITLGAGGSCGAISISATPSFTSVTTGSLTNAGALSVSTTATAGNDDIVFSNAGTENFRIEEDGDLKFERGANDAFFAVAAPSGSAATYTFSGATGTVLTSGNYAASLDSVYVNVAEAPAAGDITGSFTGGLNIGANTVTTAKIADANVTNAKLQNSSFNTSFGTNLSGSASVTLGGTLSVSLSATPSFTSVSTAVLSTAGPLSVTTTATAGNDDIIFSTAGAEVTRILENGDFMFEKGTNDAFLSIATPSGANATYTLSGATGTIFTTANYSGTLDGVYVNTAEAPAAGDITGSFSGGLNINNGAVTNAKLQNSSVTVSAGTNLSGGGSVALGGTVTLNTVANPSFGTSVTSPLFTNAGQVTVSATGAGNDITLTTADQIILTGFDCTSFTNGGALTVSATGMLQCSNDDGGAAGTITGAGTTGRLAFFDSSSNLSNSWLNQNSSTLELDNTRNLSLLGGNLSVAGNGTFSGTLTVPTIQTAGVLSVTTTATAGNDDIIFSTAGTETARIQEDGQVKFEKGANDAFLSIAAPSGANATYTLSGATGTILTSSNFTTSLDATYVNTTESPAAGDITGSFSAGLNIGSNAVTTAKIADGNVTNAKLQNSSFSTSFGTNLSGSASVALGGTLSVSISATPSFTSVTTATLSTAGPLSVTTTATAGADDIVFSTAGTETLRLEEDGDLKFEKGANDVTFQVATPGAAATYTFSGATGTVLTSSNFATSLDSTYVNTNESPAAGDITGSFTGGLNIGADAVALGTDTTGNYIATLGTLTGLSTTGNTGEGSTPTLSVLYGSTANTAVQGNTTLTCASGTGNLSGGGNSVTLGAGGSCSNITINNDVSFTTAVRTPLLTNAGALTVSTTGANDLSLSSGSGIINLTASTLKGTNDLTVDLMSASTEVFAITNTGTGVADLNVVEGAIQTAGTTRITNAGVLQNVTANASIITAGTLSVARGGTGVDGSAAANGSLLIGNGSGYSLTTLTQGSGISISNGAGSITIAATLGTSISNGEIDNDAVTLGTQTTGSYIATLGTLTGLSTTGNTGEGSTPTLSVLYGSGANNAAAGANTFTCSAGSGDLSGGGTTVTIGTSGTNCGNITISESPVFDTSVTSPLFRTASGPLSVTTGASAGSDDIVFSTAGAETVRIEEDGDIKFEKGTNDAFLSIATPSGANATYTLSGATGTILTSSNFSTSLDSTYVNTNESPAAGDITGSFTAGLNLGSNTVTTAKIADGNVTNAKLQNSSFSTSFGTNLSGSASVALGGTLSVSISATPSFTSVSTATLSTAGPLSVTTTATAGSDDIVFSTAGVETLRLEEDGDLKFEKGTNDVTFQVATPGAAAVYTFSGATGTVLTGANYTGTLDSVYVNTGESPAAGDIAGSFTGGLTINNASVTNAKLQNSSVTINTAGNIVGGSVSLGGNLTISTTADASFGTAVRSPLITNAGVLTLSTTGVNDLTLSSGSNLVNLNATTLRTTASLGLDLNNAAATVLTVTNSGAGVASLSVEGGATFGAAISVTGGINNNSGGITNAGAVAGVTNLSLSGAISGGTTYSGSGDINTTGGNIQTNSVTRIANNGDLQNIGNVSVSGAISGATYMGFNTASANPTYTEGRLFYDNTQKALSYYNSESAVTLNIGQENYIYVYNSTGSTIADGQAVYINGTNASVPTVALARADSATTANAVGVATHSIENNTFGYITSYGEINNLNTSTFVAGDTLYLSATTAGLLTNVRPAIPNSTVTIGRVTEVNAATGKILVLMGGLRNGALTTGSVAFGGSDGTYIEDNTNFFWDNTNKRLGIGDATPTASLTVGAGDLFQVAGASGAVTTNATGTTALTVSGAPTASATSSLIRVGGAIAGGNAAANGGTYIGLNAPAAGAGSAADLINLQTNGTSRLRVTTAGLLTATTVNSVNAFQINGTAGHTIAAACGANAYIANAKLTGGIIVNAGTAPACQNDGVSDQRVKTNVVSVDDTILERIQGVNVVTFDFDCESELFKSTNYNCQTDRQTGVLAQELAQAFPELVTTDQFGLYNVNYKALNIYTLKAVQELSRTVDELMAVKGQVTDLEGRVSSLENSGMTTASGEPTYFEDLTVGTMTINTDLFTQGALTVEGDATFNAQAFFNELVTFGNNVVFGKGVEFRDEVSFSNNTGGYALIDIGQQTVHVDFAKPFSQVPIISLSLTDGKFAQYSYTNVTATGFDIVLNTPATENLQFSWIALSVMSPTTSQQPLVVTP